MISHDALGRRTRFTASSTGKRVTLKSRDLRWLEAIRDHGPLPSDMLHAFTAADNVSAKSSRIRLADLSHEENTPHGGVYLSKPAAQRARANALNLPLVYDLSDAGWAALGAGRNTCIRPSGPFAHQLMVSTVTAAIELGCYEISGVRFISGWRILRRANARLGVNLRLVVPPRTEPHLHRLVPDQLFALEYEVGSQKQYLSFVLECDRGTEPLTSSDAARKSAIRNYLQYRHLISGGHFRAHYGLNCNMVVLNVFNSSRRLEAHAGLLRNLFPGGCSFMLLKSIEDIPRAGPRAMAHSLVLAPWMRIGLERMAIGGVLSK